MKPDSARAAPIGPLTPHLYTPTAARPLRAKLLRLRADTRVVPHAHPWGQVALSSTGVIRVTVPHGSYIVPPSRAVWIPPGVEHAVTVIEDAELLTLYLHQPRSRCGPARSAAESAGWRQCRVLEVSSLLLALALQLDATPDTRHASCYCKRSAVYSSVPCMITILRLASSRPQRSFNTLVSNGRGT